MYYASKQAPRGEIADRRGAPSPIPHLIGESKILQVTGLKTKFFFVLTWQSDFPDMRFETSLMRISDWLKNSNPNPNPVRNPVRLLQNARVSANQKSSPIRCQNLHQIRDLPSRNFQPATYATYLVQVFTSEHWKFLIGWKTATLTLTLTLYVY